MLAGIATIMVTCRTVAGADKLTLFYIEKYSGVTLCAIHAKYLFVMENKHNSWSLDEADNGRHVGDLDTLRAYPFT